jgi:hypothetical protein
MNIAAYKSANALAIDAMRRDLKRLQKVADKAKYECDEYITIGSEAIAIHNEFAQIVNSREFGEHVLKKLESLKKRREHVNKVLKKSAIQLMDKQFAAEMERDSLARKITELEFFERVKP